MQAYIDQSPITNAHNASDPVRQKEMYKYWIGWMDSYLQPGNSDLNVSIENKKD